MVMMEAIYKLKYFIVCRLKNTGKIARAQGKHREFGINSSVATLTPIGSATACTDIVAFQRKSRRKMCYHAFVNTVLQCRALRIRDSLFISILCMAVVISV